MALLMNYNLNGDLQLTNAYLRIEKLNMVYDPVKAAKLGGTKWVCAISLKVRPTKAKNEQDTWIDDRWIFAYQTGAGNLLTQAYTYLKSLPEFSTAVDDVD